MVQTFNPNHGHISAELGGLEMILSWSPGDSAAQIYIYCRDQAYLKEDPDSVEPQKEFILEFLRNDEERRKIVEYFKLEPDEVSIIDILIEELEALEEAGENG